MLVGKVHAEEAGWVQSQISRLDSAAWSARDEPSAAHDLEETRCLMIGALVGRKGIIDTCSHVQDNAVRGIADGIGLCFRDVYALVSACTLGARISLSGKESEPTGDGMLPHPFEELPCAFMGYDAIRPNGQEPSEHVDMKGWGIPDVREFKRYIAIHKSIGTELKWPSEIDLVGPDPGPLAGDQAAARKMVGANQKPYLEPRDHYQRASERSQDGREESYGIVCEPLTREEFWFVIGCFFGGALMMLLVI
jgi:hypothetical protein